MEVSVAARPTAWLKHTWDWKMRSRYLKKQVA